MKSVSVSTFLGIIRDARVVVLCLGLVLCVLAFCSNGCSQAGETTAEGRRRHQRNVRLNQQGLNRDIDKVLLMDQPSKLTERRIP